MGIWSKAKERAKNFYRKHKVGIIATTAGLGSGAMLWFGYKLGADNAIKHLEKLTLPEPEKSDETENEELEPWYGFYWKEGNFWRDGMRERYDKVIDFAEELHLGDGEIFGIEGINPDLHPYGKDYLVMHAVDGMRSYPYDEEVAKKVDCVVKDMYCMVNNDE